MEYIKFVQSKKRTWFLLPDFSSESEGMGKKIEKMRELTCIFKKRHSRLRTTSFKAHCFCKCFLFLSDMVTPGLLSSVQDSGGQRPGSVHILSFLFNGSQCSTI